MALVPRTLADGRAVTALAVNGALYLLGRLTTQSALSASGLLHAALLGALLWTSLGCAGWSTCLAFLVLGSMATRVKLAEKQSRGIAEKRGGARGPENVWGAAATAAVCALLYSLSPVLMARGAARVAYLCKLAFVAAMCTKLSDTVASEIGKAYGRTAYLVTTLRRVPPGTDGAVSAEGTAAGAFASLLLALFCAANGLLAPSASAPSAAASTAAAAAALPWWRGVALCVAAAFVATSAESVIGATLQRRFAWLNNEIVNVINTTLGAVTAVALALAAMV